MKTICLRFEPTFPSSEDKRAFETSVTEQLELIADMENSINEKTERKDKPAPKKGKKQDESESSI